MSTNFLGLSHGKGRGWGRIRFHVKRQTDMRDFRNWPGAIQWLNEMVKVYEASLKGTNMPSEYIPSPRDWVREQVER